MIERAIQQRIESKFFKGKAIILLGPRQVGKTTLIQSILKNKPHLFLDGDDASIRILLSEPDTFSLKQLIGKHTIVFIDEAQRIPGIGITLKLITDQIKQVQLFVSGSSALEINDKTQESLTGRKWEYNLYPISWEELEQSIGFFAAEQQLEHRLVYGMYPDVINHIEDEHQVLQQLANSYLYKDILTLTGIKKPEMLERLLQALALQLGSEVSYNELANLLGIDKLTVMRYINVLEKSFIVFQLNSFSRNQRNEIKNNRKIYFYDNGIRNMIINNLNPLDLRSDKGALWENFLISERIKKQAYHQEYINHYFWRTVQKQEIDFVEEANGAINAFEFKWKSGGRKKIPNSFLETYSATGKIIDRGNFREFVMQ
ncbi:MAG: ATP-binding protein [Bacteroidota bacterium]|nr:ATP-binding protein [Bacteroidota bacterium]